MSKMLLIRSGRFQTKGENSVQIEVEIAGNNPGIVFWRSFQTI